MNSMVCALLLNSPKLMDKWWEALTAIDKLKVMVAAANASVTVPEYEEGNKDREPGFK